MKLVATALLLLPAVVAAQDRATLTRPVTMEIRSLDSTRVSTVSIDVTGGLFESVGVLRPASGHVQCALTGCVATTPAVLELSVRPGEGELRVPADAPELAVTVIETGEVHRRLVAFGHIVSFARDSTGRLVVRAPRMVTQF